MSPNGGDTTPPPRLAGLLVVTAVLFVFALGVGVGFALCKGLG